MSDLPGRVSLREVGPRDGLQNENPVPTGAKIELINALSQTGVSRIEAVSFVRPEAIPQMADADQVWRGIERTRALVLAVAAFGVPFLRWQTTTYGLTTRRLSLRSGILTRSGRDFPLIRISDVSFSQGPLDRLLGSGRLVVESAGEHGQLVLNEIPDVQEVQATLFQLVGDEHQRLAREEN